jgi:hypothetical protein
MFVHFNILEEHIFACRLCHLLRADAVIISISDEI